MLKKFSLGFCLSFLVVALAACVSVRGTVLDVDGPVYPKVAPAEVRVFLSGAEVPGPFENVGIIRARRGAFVADDKVFNALRKKASAMGANGLIMGGPVNGRNLLIKDWTATAIRFKSLA